MKTITRKTRGLLAIAALSVTLLLAGATSSYAGYYHNGYYHSSGYYYGNGYYYHHGYPHYTYYNNHRGYWGYNNGVRIWINL